MYDSSDDTTQNHNCNDANATVAHTVSAVASADEETQVDPDGDLIIRAGSQTGVPGRSFRVCASALRRSSQVWKKMLFGPFKESKPAFGTWIVNLPEDNPGALEILLHIVHANFPSVQHAPTLSGLYEVLRLANKYDMITALKPWAGLWLEVTESFSVTTDGRGMASLAYIAWELGPVELQREMMKELILRSSVDEDGRMTTADGVVLNDFEPIGPPGLLGYMRSHQQELFKALSLQLNPTIRELTDGPGFCVAKTASAEEKTNCNNTILGSLMKAMASDRGSVSLTLTGKEGENAAQFSASIRHIADGISAYQGHMKCNPGGRIMSMLAKSIKARNIKLNKGSIEKMDKRREDLGLNKSTPQETSD